MKKLSISALLVIFISLLPLAFAVAQADQLSIKLSRDWGYGGFNNDIQGLFTMHVTGPADLAKVVFYIDNTAIGEVDQAPFNLQFNTDNYPLGVHDIYAVGNSSGNQEYRSNVLKANFVPASQGGKVVIPLLSVVFVAILVSALVPLLMSRKKIKLPLGTERNYGIRGGAICPKCQRPFVLPLISAHVGFSKLAVCPYCGKTGLVKPESLDKLRQTEKAELEWAKSGVSEPASEDDKLRKDMDDSKYQGL